jgi:Ca2+-binding RTX toxin-like protein
MFLRKWLVVASASLLLLAGVGLLSAFSASNTVAATRAGSVTFVINANALKPTECNALTLTRLVILARGDTPSGSNELIIGTTGSETISGGGGADCILGGNGNDTLRGGNGQDILIGGPGNDFLDGGGGNGDVCYGGGQAGDTFNRCETIVP